MCMIEKWWLGTPVIFIRYRITLRKCISSLSHFTVDITSLWYKDHTAVCFYKHVLTDAHWLANQTKVCYFHVQSTTSFAIQSTGFPQVRKKSGKNENLKKSVNFDMGQEILKFTKKSGKMQLISIWKPQSKFWLSMSWCGSSVSLLPTRNGETYFYIIWHFVN